MQTCNENRRQALNRIASGLVGRFAAGPVGVGLMGLNRAKAHATVHDTGFTALPVSQCHGCEHFMFAPGQRGKHGQRIGLINRLAENAPVEHHCRVSPQHTGLLINRQYGQPGLSLAKRKTLDIGSRGFSVEGGFVDLSAECGEGHTDLSQKFATARRARSQIKRGHKDISVSVRVGAMDAAERRAHLALN
ncbi:hypothetical protein KPSA3_05891 [Pseudomonas syringae pv. actinidiae]|uniref:Uncharacterized protein n=1 Tax=Pseudomonas syringae pv. actinidiae TaxID=103796 RepID=A0AAN4TNJ5_PSESF|nr:hypothetical protein KPSA3_05891 [Pseudomonas syringae pv. actinidiae]